MQVQVGLMKRHIAFACIRYGKHDHSSHGTVSFSTDNFRLAVKSVAAALDELHPQEKANIIKRGFKRQRASLSGVLTKEDLRDVLIEAEETVPVDKSGQIALAEPEAADIVDVPLENLSKAELIRRVQSLEEKNTELRLQVRYEKKEGQARVRA